MTEITDRERKLNDCRRENSNSFISNKYNGAQLKYARTNFLSDPSPINTENYVLQSKLALEHDMENLRQGRNQRNCTIANIRKFREEMDRVKIIFESTNGYLTLPNRRRVDGAIDQNLSLLGLIEYTRANGNLNRNNNHCIIA